jgi:hypothetical protein
MQEVVLLLTTPAKIVALHPIKDKTLASSQDSVHNQEATHGTWDSAE